MATTADLVQKLKDAADAAASVVLASPTVANIDKLSSSVKWLSDSIEKLENGLITFPIPQSDVVDLLADLATITANIAGKEAAFAKNTAFNLDLGILAGQAAEGDHNHNATYEAIDTSIRRIVDIVDDLVSTGTDKMLSANQGKVLNDKITALSGQTTTTTDELVFSDQSSQTVAIQLPVAAGSNFPFLIEGKIYISENPTITDAGNTVPFSTLCTLQFFKSDQNGFHEGNELIWENDAQLVYSTLAAPAVAPDIELNVTDETDFSYRQLVTVKDGLEFSRLAGNPGSSGTQVANPMPISNQVTGSYVAGDGVALVATIGDFGLIDVEAVSKVYMRVKFANTQRLKVKFDATWKLVI